jgi:DNA-binding IclR family transcriptional regulator
VALLSAQVTDERIEKMKKHVRNTAQNLSKERGYFEDRFPEAALAS